MALERGAIPLYHQIEEELEQRIHAGNWEPGDRIPTERELAAHYGVSRITVRRAVLDLVGKGFLYRVAGKGTFVAHPTKIDQPIWSLTSFTQDMLRHDMEPKSRVISGDLVLADATMALRLEVPEKSEVARIVRLRLGDREPLILERTHLVHTLCPGILRHDLARSSLYEILTRDYNLVLSHGVQTFRPVLIPAEEANLLGLPAGAPGFLSNTMARLIDERVIEWTEAIYRGDRYVFTAKLSGFPSYSTSRQTGLALQLRTGRDEPIFAR